MKLSVENFGAISKAEIDLNKDLIILTGENNTGKTYLAYLIYNVFNPFSTKSDDWTITDGLTENDVFFSQKNEKLNLRKLTAEFILCSIKSRIEDRFSVTSEFFEKAEFSLKIMDNSVIGNKIRELVLKKEKAVFVEDNIPEDIKLFFSKKKGSDFVTVDEENLRMEYLYTVNYEIILFLVRLIKSNFLSKSYLIPAERQGINLFHKELSLIKNKVFDKLLSNGASQELFSFLQTRFNQYSKPIKDALEINQNLDVLQKETSEFIHLAKELEKSFLKGNVFISAEGDIKYQPEKGKNALDIHMTSSTVKSLATLSLYLRHIAKEGDFLIIDEPELNLHPDNQRKIAQFIGKLISSGFKVMISTHSEYILREINNLIALNTGFKKNEKEAKKLLDEYGYEEKHLLSPKQVGVYLFKQGKDVESVEIGETGFAVETIDNVTNQMIETTNNILFTLHDF